MAWLFPRHTSDRLDGQGGGRRTDSGWTRHCITGRLTSPVVPVWRDMVR